MRYLFPAPLFWTGPMGGCPSSRHIAGSWYGAQGEIAVAFLRPPLRLSGIGLDYVRCCVESQQPDHPGFPNFSELIKQIRDLQIQAFKGQALNLRCWDCNTTQAG